MQHTLKSITLLGMHGLAVSAAKAATVSCESGSPRLIVEVWRAGIPMTLQLAAQDVHVEPDDYDRLFAEMEKSGSLGAGSVASFAVASLVDAINEG